MNRNVWTIVLASAVVYGLLAVLMGVVPGIALSGEAPMPGLRPYSAQEQRGRDVYVSEGCEYCHTQNVRPLKQDLVFGRPSAAGDYAYETPELLGDHRNGPDLTNIAKRQPSIVWQYIHLWNPRAVVQGSIMPRYAWLFEVKPKADPGDIVVPVPPGFGPAGGTVVAAQSAQDLVAYLEALKQVPLLKGGAK
ncbi:MAG: cbb3-type cytochrome c oxidase subunit II [Candidatus Baltobacteraceae bacterium]